MSIIKFVLKDNANLPVKANETDSGYDIVATSINVHDELKYVEYGTGLFISSMPKHLEMELRPRSSISKYDLIMCNSPGTIDVDYRGEIKVRFKLIPTLSILKQSKTKLDIELFTIYELGDKIAQMIIREKTKVRLVSTDVLEDESNRGGGFGSTGN